MVRRPHIPCRLSDKSSLPLPPSTSLVTANRNRSNMALQDFLDQQPPISDAVKQYLLPVNHAAQSGDDEIEKSLWKSWNELIETAATTPHSQQDPLVEFVQQLRKEQSPKKQNGESCKVWGNSVEWKNLPLLGPAFREVWNNSESS